MKIERKQFSGVMNLDDPNEVMVGTHHREAFNVLFKGNPGEMRAEGIPGNRSVANAGLQSGTNVCIGSYYDELKQRVFYFVYNSNGFDAIFVYNTITRGISTLLMSKIDSLSTETLFNFSPDYPIASVNILYRTEEDGDILHWTDRNNPPMKLNIKEAEAVGKTYAGNWKFKYLTTARPMPLISPICRYEDDAATSINNLKSKLYQFRYRWIYRDFTKSAWSPWSRLFAPANVDTLSTEVDPTKNNRISVKYQTGDADVVKIEIASRQSIDSTFSDPFLVETINKTSIPNNTEYEYKFYNTEAYPYVDVAESNQLFDYVPLKANTQELLNGNVLAYAGITEGRTPGVTISATQSLSLVQNTQTSTPFTMSSYNRYTFTYFPVYNTTGGYHYIIFDGTPNVGDSYLFTLSFRRDIGAGVESTSVQITIPTLTVGQNTQQQVEAILLTQLQANVSLQNYGLASYVQTLQLVEPGEFNNKRGIKIGGNTVNEAWVLDSYNFQYTYAGGGGLPSDVTGVNTACYKHKSRYSFGICYFDENGVTNGVMTSDSLKVVTPEIVSTDLGGTSLTIPMIEFTITNQAPLWAKYFSFVRTANLTTSEFKTVITDQTEKDAGAGYAYLAITSLQTNKSGYQAYSFSKGDRVRIIGRKNQANLIYDYPVVAVVSSLEANITPADNTWLKVPYDSTWMTVFGTAGYDNYYIEVYTPALNASEENQLFYEFGEVYPVIESGVNRYHTGMIQNQTASQGAIYKFFRGDIYNRLRDTVWILDKSMSDKYNSKVDGNGRAFVVDEYAKNAYYPTLIRYSIEYQSGTNINQTNRFYAANFDEYDRERGDIQRLRVRGRQLRVFQNRACGVVPILQAVVQTADGSDVLSQSVQIINKIQYYQGDYGIGNQFTSLASSANADYFTDPVRGCQVRLSGDGITPITELYKAHFYFNQLIVKYNKSTRTNISGQGKAKILGIYDQFNEEFVTVMQESAAGDDKSNPYTFGFNEFRNAYTSFYNYSPEWITTAENMVISWKNGVLYTHDNTANYCNFYGVQFKPSITSIFNQYGQIKKRYNTITMLANKVWAPDTNGDITTNLGQRSKLAVSDFLFKDDKIHAAFKRDAGAGAGTDAALYNGNVLKGNWASIKLQPANGNEFVNLYYIELAILEPFYNR
jgi:hypothetical protein